MLKQNRIVNIFKGGKIREQLEYVAKKAAKSGFIIAKAAKITPTQLAKASLDKDGLDKYVQDYEKAMEKQVKSKRDKMIKDLNKLGNKTKVKSSGKKK